MTRARARVIGSEQGAVFVQVGISLFVLMAFNVFVLDYGMMWIGRSQAQNAADAGALAGAIAMGYDDFDDPPASDGVAAQSALNVASANLIWQESGTPSVLFSCPSGVAGRCVRVDVYRNGQNGSTPMPTLFGPILGVTNQGVRATATGIVGAGNATDCLRPIAFADDWLEQQAPITEFNSYDETTGAPLPGTRDSYTAPSASQSGRTTVSSDLGERIIWELDRDPEIAPITRGLVLSLSLPGTATYRQNIDNCNGQPVELRQTLPVITSIGSISGQTIAGFTYLMSLDPGVDWNEAGNRIDNSCAPGCAPISPRLIPVALYDPARFQLGRASNDWTQAAVGCPTNNPCITVTNIVGFFVHGPFAIWGPHGHFLKYPGLTSTTAPTFVDDASWMVTTHLVR